MDESVIFYESTAHPGRHKHRVSCKWDAEEQLNALTRFALQQGDKSLYTSFARFLAVYEPLMEVPVTKEG